MSNIPSPLSNKKLINNQLPTPVSSPPKYNNNHNQSFNHSSGSLTGSKWSDSESLRNLSEDDFEKIVEEESVNSTFKKNTSLLEKFKRKKVENDKFVDDFLTENEWVNLEPDNYKSRLNHPYNFNNSNLSSSSLHSNDDSFLGQIKNVLGGLTKLTLSKKL